MTKFIYAVAVVCLSVWGTAEAGVLDDAASAADSLSSAAKNVSSAADNTKSAINSTKSTVNNTTSTSGTTSAEVKKQAKEKADSYAKEKASSAVDTLFDKL